MELDSLDRLILSSIYGATDIAELVAKVGLARTTVLKHLNRLIREGLIARDKILPKGRGRPKFIYRVESISLLSPRRIQVVSLTFQKLKEACRFGRGMWCMETKKVCTPESCSLILK